MKIQEEIEKRIHLEVKISILEEKVADLLVNQFKLESRLDNLQKALGISGAIERPETREL